jgi:DNA primase
LIERARLQFPGRTAEAKVKAMNYLLPHIRRMPNALQRNEFAQDAAQKLGIDSGILLQEVKQAAARRVESVAAKKVEALSETEGVLLRALASPGEARVLAVEGLEGNPDWYEGLAAGGLIEALVHGAVPENPLDAAADVEGRAMLARALERAWGEVMVGQVRDALGNLERRSAERRLRELRMMMAEAERRGDTEMMGKLERELMGLMRKLREM